MMTFWVMGYGRCFFLPASTRASEASSAKQTNKEITCRKEEKEIPLVTN
jgi:hypothetical protein